jgi:hypothetical protein
MFSCEEFQFEFTAGFLLKDKARRLKKKNVVHKADEPHKLTKKIVLQKYLKDRYHF